MQGPATSSLLYKRWWIIGVGIVFCVYLVNCWATSFRLTNDTVRYFALLENLEGTWPATLKKRNDFLPYGYVYFLAILSKLHLLSPFAIAFCHFLYLCGSLYFVKKLFGATIHVFPFLFFTLLSWTAIKYMLIPLSEMQFLFFSTATLYCYELFLAKRSIWLLLLTAVLCYVCIITRTAGIALVLACMVSFLLSNSKKMTLWARQYPLYATAVIVTACALLVFLITRPTVVTYLSYLFGPLLHDPLTFFSYNMRIHFTDWTELFINIPLSKTGFLIPPRIGEIIYILTGVFFMGLIVYRLIKNRPSIPTSVSAYLVVYILLIFNWPFVDGRFWLPIMPLVAAVLLQRTYTPKPFFDVARKGYVMYYVASGIFVLGHYTRTSFDRAYFLTRHDKGKWELEYEAHFGMRKPGDPPVPDKEALYILNKYD